MRSTFILTAFSVAFANGATIDICVNKKENGATSPLSGASVKCWDEDLFNADDAMTDTETTDSNGCVSLYYQKKKPKWYNPCAGWDCPGYTNPDIYCKITKSNYYPLYTNTKEDWNQNNVANFGTVNIYPDRVARGDPGGINGCGPASDWDDINYLADFITGFGDQCNNHDLCYNNCQESQHNCDVEFREMMYSKCNDDIDHSDKDLCKTVADGMYNLVAGFGSGAYNNAQALYGCR